MLHEDAQDIARLIQTTKKALDIDPNNVKALYRSATAYIKDNELCKASEQLKKAAMLNPNDSAIRKALQTLSTAKTKALKQEKQTWGGRLLQIHTQNIETKRNGSAPKSAIFYRYALAPVIACAILAAIFHHSF